VDAIDRAGVHAQFIFGTSFGYNVGHRIPVVEWQFPCQKRKPSKIKEIPDRGPSRLGHSTQTQSGT